MRIEQNDALAKTAIESGLGRCLEAPHVGLVVIDGESLAGVVAITNYDRHNVDLTAIVIKPWTTRAVREIARYLFDRLGAKRVTCTTLTTNYRAINRLLKLGFEYELTQRQRFPQGDAFVFGLLAADQRIMRQRS